MTSQQAAGAASADAARHPLDPLNEDEIRQAVSILADDGRVTSPMRFVSVGLREPAKDEVVSFGPGQAFAREARIVALDRREHMTYEAVVSITARSVLSWRPVPGARAPITLGEIAEFERLVRADRRFRAGLRRRGIHNPDQVVVEPWGIGAFAREEEAGRRLFWALTFYRAGPGDNPYAKPIHGLHAVVDLDDMAVVRVEDLGVVPLPPGAGDYTTGGTPRAGLKPIELRQPAGVSFQVDG